MAESLISSVASPARKAQAPGVVSRRRLLYLAPLAGFGGLAAIFASRLGGDPSRIPSTLIGKPVPKFDLPPVQGRALGLSSDDLVGEVSLVNVFASWCVACRAEHPLLMRLAADKTMTIHGLNYKDRPEDAARWLNGFGDPYTRTGADRDGRVAIDWGVYGVPETFVVGSDGRIAYKHIGPIDESALRDAILPLVNRLQQKEARP
ncbi:MAG TPA: DsbE family thiol:disulfide interchange protein [Roseiarcus sp.]|nr:DsbE family thiol:disulfide interchange protein [Roseiarcus sp.]